MARFGTSTSRCEGLTLCRGRRCCGSLTSETRPRWRASATPSTGSAWTTSTSAPNPTRTTTRKPPTSTCPTIPRTTWITPCRSSPKSTASTPKSSERRGGRVLPVGALHGVYTWRKRDPEAAAVCVRVRRLAEESLGKHEIDRPRIERAVREILIAIGEDPHRAGVLGTPRRVAEAYESLFAGLGEDP